MAESWDVFRLLPGGDYDQPEYLATLYSASQQQIIVELDNTGSGSFSINRSAPECTEEVLAQGNLVKVRIPEIHTDYVFAFFLETGDFTLVSSQETGGEQLNFGGRGILSYLEYARAWSESFIDGGQDPEAGVWRAYNAGTGSKPGQILRRLLEEFQDADRPQQPLPLLTIDFDYDDDSTADMWDDTDATDEFSYQVGEDGLAIVQRLLETETIRVQMDPNFLLSAYNVDNFGRDLTGDAFGAGVVRFERGVNIATELRREQSTAQAVPDTHMLVQGEADKYGTAALSDAASRVTKEAFMPAFGTGTTPLDAIGAVELAERLKQSVNIQFPINNRRTEVSLADPVTVGAVKAAPGLATAGFYLPGPEGTNGDFWVGDTVRVHTGAGPFDYNETDALVRSITIAREDDNAELAVFVELVSPVQVPGTPSYFTVTHPGGCVSGPWPEGAPGAGKLLVSFLAQRDASTHDATIAPIGYLATDQGCNILSDVPGTEWTFIDGFNVAGGGMPISMAWRDSTALDPVAVRWGGVGGFSGSAGPRQHTLAIEGLSGAPTVLETNDNQSTSGSVFTSPNITVPTAGYIFAGFSYTAKGPADGFSAAFEMVARDPAVNLTAGYAQGGFSPYSWFGYLHVASAGTYNIVLDRSAVPRDPNRAYGWIVGFWPE